MSDVVGTAGAVTVPPRWNQRRTVAIVVIVLVIAGVVIGLVASNSSTPTTMKHSGTVNVLYAGSFEDIMQQSIDPAFHSATGYTVSGIGDDSMSLATEIKGGVQVGDVFISASPKADDALAGPSNGSWVTTYQEFGKSDLELAYNPSSSFATALMTEPWYNVLTKSGFRLGRTDPATDPKGVLAVDALDEAASAHNLPALSALGRSTTNIYAETALVGELQSGQLDAGFFYAVEAKAAKLVTVPLSGTNLAAMYTVTQLRNAPHSAAAKAFIAFLLGAKGRAILTSYGVTPLVPAVQHSVS
jgi:molybdate/tungstate transport system substrate-binding protein